VLEVFLGCIRRFQFRARLGRVGSCMILSSKDGIEIGRSFPFSLGI
jgi:hypothetical protein